jgi:histidinol-phosphate phosphatase family protein
MEAGNLDETREFVTPGWQGAASPAPAEGRGKHAALFLDRDGVLVEDTGYIRDPNSLVYKDDVLRGLAGFDFLRTREVPLGIVSNQSGIARGLVTQAEAEAVNLRLLEYMRGYGLDAAGVWYCPYHKDGVIAEFTRESLLRKPQPGMFFLAARALDLDLPRSLMVGDKASDRIALPYLESFLFDGGRSGQGGTLGALLRRIEEKFRFSKGVVR